MKLLIVIVNYKVTDLTIDCLRSLEAEVAALPGTKVAVCENGTGPGAVEQLQKAIGQESWADWVSLTTVYPNRGFTGGNNVILRAALESHKPPEYFLLLNADTIVRPARCALVEFMDENPKVGIAGSRLENLAGVPRSTAFRFFGIASEFDRGLRLGPVSRLLAHWQVTRPLPDRPCQTDWVSGASVIIRREVLRDVGLLDEDLYTYFDDIDICLNACKAGWPTWHVPASRVVHLMGKSTGISTRDTRPKRRPDYWFQARRHFWLKNYGPWRTALADMAWITGFALWRLRRWLQRKPDTDPPKLLWDSIRHSVFVRGFRRRPVKNPAL